MKVLIFGATGMLGQGVLRACLADKDITLVQTVGRTTTGQIHPKLREVAHADLWNYASIEDQLAGFDACFFCLGVSSNGITPEQYERMTYDLTLAAGTTLARLNPEMRFIYISGKGTDANGASHWAKVKGRTENALLALPFQAVMFRPAAIEPVHGEVSKTPSYRLFYKIVQPLKILTLLRRLLPAQITTTEELAKAMIAVARYGSTQKIIEGGDFAALAKQVN
ncbi:NAD-dependent epimerase/dehydratase family protein [Rouxiella sp. Mn2063]|uniref:NAD-dependent epimerase/dehydratase family protein n=1 Tax=Rouxiella sp. Mn2063 TaxID=3395262 RepID=UPI003BBBE930